VAAIARAVGARVELFHAEMPPVVVPGAAPVPKSRYSMTDRLERLTRSPHLKGLRVTGHLERDYPPHEAIIRRALAVQADLVIASLRVPSFPGRLWLRSTDWELIRECPCPVLLVKSSRAYRRPAIVAAVDPFHAHAKPAGLDRTLLETARSVAQALRGSVHVFHSYLPLVSLMPMPMGPLAPVGYPPALEDAHGQQVARVFDLLGKSADIPPSRRHLHMGDVASELSATVKRLHAGMVVMGAVSRSALKRAFIGSTAEATLGSISCDVLVVKPRGFKTSVPRRKRSLP
jgi:universal stress protein E